MSDAIAKLFAEHVNRESYPVITYERFMEMLAERGLAIQSFWPPSKFEMAFSISKDGRLVEQYSSEIFPCYFTEEIMERELDKISHPDYEWSIHGIRAKDEESEQPQESQSKLTEQELLDQIRAGVTQEMESALTADINPVLMHAVTQSYLLLKILDKLEAKEQEG